MLSASPYELSTVAIITKQCCTWQLRAVTVSIFMNVMYETAEKECARSAKKHSPN